MRYSSHLAPTLIGYARCSTDKQDLAATEDAGRSSASRPETVSAAPPGGERGEAVGAGPGVGGAARG